MPKTLELLRVALEVTGLVHYRLKHALACRRPVEYSPQVQPIVPTPGHGTLPSGHATEVFTAAFVFDALVRYARENPAPASPMPPVPDFDPASLFSIQLMRIAERIAINRQVAGVHFPVDSVAGMVLAQSLSEFYVARCVKGRPAIRTFDGRGFRGDFSYSDVLANNYKRAAPAPGTPAIAGSDDIIHVEQRSVDILASPLLEHVWKQAVAECARVIGPGSPQS